MTPPAASRVRPIPRAAAVRATRATVLVLALLLAVGAAPASAVEADGVRVDPAVPAALGPGSTFRPAVPPGGAATYTLLLRNQRDTPVEVLVYGADVVDGEVAVGDDNSGVGAWIVADEPRVELEPAATSTVEFTVRRPADDEDGGTGAVVVQLSEASREELGLAALARAAVRVEVAADGTGDGVLPSIVATRATTGLLPGPYVVVARVDAAEDGATFDGAVRVTGPFGGTRDVDLPAPEPGGTTVAVLDVPWWGMVGQVRARAATVTVTSSSPPVRVLAVPSWLVGLLLAAALTATATEWRRRHEHGGAAPPQ